MKKIFKFVKQNIIGFIIGGIVFGSLGVYAAGVIAANEVAYSNASSGLSSTNVKGALDELNTKATTKIKEAEAKCPSDKLCFFAKPGDYVKMTPTSTSYTITTAMTGYSKAQTINPSELNLWRVISLNGDGTMDLVSEYVSSTNVYFKGKTGYQNYITSLNTIASQYTNSKYTVGTRHMGYNGQTGTITDTSALDSTTAPWTTETSSSPSASDEAKGGGDIGYERDYDLVNKALGTAKAYKAGTTTAAYYWLASRYFCYDSSTYWYFGGRVVGTIGSSDNGDVYSYDSSLGGFTAIGNSDAVRPIVTLKSGLTPSGSGTSSSPYVLS